MGLSEKNDMIEEGQRIISTIKQMEASLDDAKTNKLYAHKDDELKISYPLHECLQILKEKHNAICKLHQERFDQVRSKSRTCSKVGRQLTPHRAYKSTRILFLPFGTHFPQD